jgi:hypothetical protein
VQSVAKWAQILPLVFPSWLKDHHIRTARGFLADAVNIPVTRAFLLFVFGNNRLTLLVFQGGPPARVTIIDLINKHCRMFAQAMAYSSYSGKSSAEKVVQACRQSTEAVRTV